MSYLAVNIRFLRTRQGLKQQELAELLGVQRSMISAYEDGRSEPKLAGLQKLAKHFKVRLDRLIEEDLSLERQPVGEEKRLQVLAVTLDREEEERIALIPQKASAGYLNGYADPEYMGELHHFSLPHLRKDLSYRAFELSGDSMLPLVPGTLIIGAYVLRPEDIKSGQTYVLITGQEGIVYKRVFNYIPENGKLYLVSDNPQYKPYEIPASDVLEVWEAKAYISTQLPSPQQAAEPVTLEDLAAMLNEIKAALPLTKQP
ncbi:helix-turn-helix domain-containing protein [Nitritalea halalkaliphila LW7]|uniref:Helix-turn-helix domain-containing protein n=1 Tax=Nitritalea halalkaliphila LW7 TaxID=1189621 RepID=I5C8F1_9BACT|nr:helix-turn-helix domain-containing protein [Nitritalea halalkaliphila]EIM78103.1 helix-turn-helix domain-containing protein [Nitritalea halalkaliphila LW7]